jgi:hypothetical protein
LRRTIVEAGVPEETTAALEGERWLTKYGQVTTRGREVRDNGAFAC